MWLRAQTSPRPALLARSRSPAIPGAPTCPLAPTAASTAAAVPCRRLPAATPPEAPSSPNRGIRAGMPVLSLTLSPIHTLFVRDDRAIEGDRNGDTIGAATPSHSVWVLSYTDGSGDDTVEAILAHGLMPAGDERLACATPTSWPHARLKATYVSLFGDPACHHGQDAGYRVSPWASRYPLLKVGVQGSNERTR